MPNRTDICKNIAIAKMLKNARQAKGVTQSQMSIAIDVSKNHLSAIERGQSKASVEILLGYCARLQMTPNEILGYKEQQ